MYIWEDNSKLMIKQDLSFENLLKNEGIKNFAGEFLQFWV